MSKSNKQSQEYPCLSDLCDKMERGENRKNYCFFNGPQHLRKYKYMIIGEHPGSIKTFTEKNGIKSACRPNDLIKVFRGGLVDYFDHNYKFWKKGFLDKLRFSKKVQNAFPNILTYFYYTDAIKERNRKRNKLNDDDRRCLGEEIDTVQPKFIFSFGKEALDALKWWCSTRRKKHELTESKAGVKDLNGQVFRPPDDEEGPVICILTHYSPRPPSPNIDGLAACLGDGRI